MNDMLLSIQQAVAALTLFSLVSGAAYGAAAWLLPAGSSARRWAASVIVAHWFQIGSFQLLAAFNGFRPAGALVASVFFAGCIGWLRRRFPRNDCSLAAILRQDLRTARTRINQALSGPARRLVLLCLASVGVALVRGVVNMPITADSFSYHLMYAGMFVQTGGWFDIDTPGLWGESYRFYATGGEILAAWLMMPFHGDLLAGLTCFPSWGLLLAATYSLSRELGLPPCRAAISACAVGFMPAVFGFISAVYVDIPLTACLLGGSLFFVEAWKTGGLAAFFLCGAALGTALAIKIFGLGCVIAALILLGVRCAVSRTREWRGIHWLVMIGAMAAVGARHYLQLFLLYGSPTWPMPLGLPGLPLFAGSAGWADYLRHLAEVTDRMISGGLLEKEIIWYVSHVFGMKPLSLGPLCLVTLILAPIGLARAWKQVGKGIAMYLALVLAASFAGLLGNGMWKFHVIFASVNARLIAFPAALVLILGFLAAEGWRDSVRSLLMHVFVFLIAAAFLLSMPFTWGTGFPAFDLLLLMLIGLAALAPIRAVPEFSLPPVAAVVAVFLAGLTILQGWKADLRPQQFLGAYEGHGFGRESALAWILCDDPAQSRRIAFSAGHGLISYNWGWSPLLGRNLQNYLTYLPITKTGEIIEYTDPAIVAQKADFESWLARLREQRIDTVVLALPFPPEFDWVISRPDLFRPEGSASPTLVFQVLQPGR